MLFATVTSVAGRIFGGKCYCKSRASKTDFFQPFSFSFFFYSLTAYITAFGQRRMTVEHQKPNNFIEEKKINDVTAVGLL